MKAYAKKNNIKILNSKALIDTKLNNMINRNKNVSRVLYNQMLSNSDTSGGYKNWEVKLNKEVKWDKIFEYTNKINEIKLKWFQIRICHRILVTNTILESMGIEQSNSCNFCNNDKDSVYHYLWLCPSTQIFWRDFVENIITKTNHLNSFHTNAELVLFGRDDGTQTDKGLDSLLLYAKYCIYISRINKAQPSLDQFKKYLKDKIYLEKYISQIDLSLSLYESKWNNYKGLLEFYDIQM